jgi:hypothetical protein
MGKKGNEGGGLPAVLGRQAVDPEEGMTGPLGDGDDSQGEGEVERAAGCPRCSQVPEALNLGGVTMATLQAEEKNVGCKANFLKKPKQTALGFLVAHREAEENAAIAAREMGGGAY